MAQSIPELALRNLIDLGATEDTSSRQTLLESLKPFDVVNRQHWNTWDVAVVGLAKGNTDDLDPAGQWALDQLRQKAASITKGPWKKWLKSLCRQVD